MVSRAGFSLIELIVAFALLAVAVFSLGASSAASSAWLRQAEAESGAVLLAGALLDSLAASTAAGAGSVDAGRYHAEWSALDSAGLVRLRVDVTWSNGTRADSLTFATHAGLPPELVRVQ
jgi:type II secretory pathway pseudopilin PulG